MRIRGAFKTSTFTPNPYVFVLPPFVCVASIRNSLKAKEKLFEKRWRTFAFVCYFERASDLPQTELLSGFIHSAIPISPFPFSRTHRQRSREGRTLTVVHVVTFADAGGPLVCGSGHDDRFGLLHHHPVRHDEELFMGKRHTHPFTQKHLQFIPPIHHLCSLFKATVLEQY